METKNNALVIGLLTLILGLGIGYFAGMSTVAHKMPGGVMAGDDMRSAMDGMTAGLDGKTGDEFDRAFIEGMIVHHEGAVAMAQQALQKAKHDEIKTMANDIISAQTREINTMRGWLQVWYND